LILEQIFRLFQNKILIPTIPGLANTLMRGLIQIVRFFLVLHRLLDKGIKLLTIHLTTLHTLRRHLHDRKYWTIITCMFCISFEISTIDETLDIPSLYWIHKLHKCPYK
jgi:hypothetical protein